VEHATGCNRGKSGIADANANNNNNNDDDDGDDDDDKCTETKKINVKSE
jgi:hypothetical protein